MPPPGRWTVRARKEEPRFTHSCVEHISGRNWTEPAGLRQGECHAKIHHARPAYRPRRSARQGIPRRKQVFRDLAKSFGATVEAVYWTMGQYDFVVIVDAPDDTAMTTLSISLGTRGNGRTQTLRAFEEAEVEDMLKNVVTPS